MAHSESEITAALAHETAHVMARHFARIEHKRQIWGRVALAGGPAGYLIRRTAGSLLTRKLIRNSEFEADRLCLKYQSASGYESHPVRGTVAKYIPGRGRICLVRQEALRHTSFDPRASQTTGENKSSLTWSDKRLHRGYEQLPGIQAVSLSPGEIRRSRRGGRQAAPIVAS